MKERKGKEVISIGKKGGKEGRRGREREKQIGGNVHTHSDPSAPRLRRRTAIKVCEAN